jgi:hypothetical protein
VTDRRWLPWLAVAVIAASAVIGFSYGVLSASHRIAGSVASLLGDVAWVSLLFGVLAGFFLLIRYVFPFLIAGLAPEHARERVAALRASGPPIWSGWPGGAAGSLWASRDLLGAEVYPGGIVVKLRFMSPSAVLVDEIRSVRLGRSLGSRKVEVEHRGVDVMSPLVLWGGPNSPQAVALSALADGRTGDLRPPGAPQAPAWPPPDIVRRAPPAPMRALSILGLIVGVVMVLVGVLVVVPEFGPLGVVWTAFALFILIWNGNRFLRRGW